MEPKEGIANAALDALTASIAVVDAAGLIVAVNKPWRDFALANHPSPRSVCEGADYLGVCDSAQGPEAGQAAEFAAGLRAVIGGELDSLSLEYPCHSPEEERWFCARATPLPQGVPARAVIAHETITARVRAERALREGERQFRAFFENSMLGISETRPDGRLIRANPAYARLFGYKSAEEMIADITDVGLELYADPRERGEVLKILEDKGFLEAREIRARRRDGSVFHVLVSAREMRGDAGELQGYQADHLDLSERKQAEAALIASREQMRALASRAQAASEEERTSTARKIHDLLSQTMTRLKIDLVWLLRRLESADEGLRAEVLRPRVAEMIGMADQAVSTVQRIATELRPAVLDSLGLCASLEWLARDFWEHFETTCRAFVPESEPLIDKDSATASFRIAQESLTNVARHSRATEVEISLLEEEGLLVLRIHDNGMGIEPEKLRNPFSIGLAGMRERALLLGGSLDILSAPGAGTTVEARLPLARSDPRPRRQA
jgi:PAS domain S-box-containing protein